MTIDEWIEFAETKAKEHRERYTTCADDPEWVKYGKIWEKEYQQLAEWLRELKAYKEDRHSCESCEDAISREAVKDTLTEEWTKYIPMELDINLSFVLEKISELPSVTPSRPKGRWIEQKDIHKHHYGWFFCSECGEFLMSSDGANYCSCCGAKMEVDE